MCAQIDLSKFDSSGFDRGAGALKEFGWLMLRKWLFERSVLRLYGLRRRALSLFGGKIGPDVVIKPGVRITFPWRLEVGRNSWIGEGVWLLNLAPIRIGRNACISQRAFLCTGSHDWSDPYFRLLTEPITVEDGAWICANVFVGPGVTIGTNAVITAGSVVTHDMPPRMVCSGNPCKPVKERRMCQHVPGPTR